MTLSMKHRHESTSIWDVSGAAIVGGSGPDWAGELQSALQSCYSSYLISWRCSLVEWMFRHRYLSKSRRYCRCSTVGQLALGVVVVVVGGVGRGASPALSRDCTRTLMSRGLLPRKKAMFWKRDHMAAEPLGLMTNDRGRAA